ncbi:MAG: META domain-containing protein, partial [Chloroflexi bacterium]|nr:META domain-containing protein [Chloroflexota bacterium]
MTKKRTLGALVALAFLITACSAGPGTGGTLEGTKWVLESYDQDGSLTILPEAQYADLEFNANRLNGFSGCNEFNGLYRAGGRTLLTSELSGTRMACDEASMAFEQQYLSLLGQSRFYSVRRGQLTIFSAERNTVLVYDAAPRNPLLGKWRVDSYGTTPGTVVGVLDGTRLDVAFQLVSVGGSGGCNAFSGTYGTSGDVVRVGRLATTRLACDPAVMDQETAFLEALQGVAFVESRGSSLNLPDRSGQILVALARPTPDVEPDASASPEPSASATPAATPTPEVTAAPTATPEPTPTPTPKPTPKPTAPPSVAPSGPPPVEIPPVASCKIVPPDGPTV